MIGLWPVGNADCFKAKKASKGSLGRASKEAGRASEGAGSASEAAERASNRVSKIIGTDIILLYEAILHLVSLISIQILSLEVVFAYPF